MFIRSADNIYLNEPNFSAMPEGTTMVDLARNVHLPTKKPCLRCHAKAGGGDWTKRGDIGLSTANPAYNEDIHMSNQGADLACADCHFRDGDQLVGRRGIGLRITEGSTPNCQDCHDAAPHSDATINRHALGQLSCQGYHQFPSTNLCSLCHSSKNMNWQNMHSKHVDDKQIDCASCHTPPPIGLTASRSDLCSRCHEYQSEFDLRVVHKKHLAKKVDCSTCHSF